MTDALIDMDCIRRFLVASSAIECELCGLSWEECDEIKEKLEETPCHFVRRFFSEMTAEQKAWLALDGEEKNKPEKGKYHDRFP